VAWSCSEVEHIEGAREGSVHPSRADPRELSLPWASTSLLQSAEAVPEYADYDHADVCVRDASTSIGRGDGISDTVMSPNVGVNYDVGKRAP
jgi:hypothetical protein